MRKSIVFAILIAALLTGVVAMNPLAQSEPQIVRVGPTRVQDGTATINPLDTLQVVRYGVDVAFQQFGYGVACYTTNPKTFGKGHPSLSCVAVPLPSPVSR